MSVFGQVIPFRARRESAPVPATRVHRSLSAALADAGLVEAPSLSELSVDPDAVASPDRFFPAEEIRDQIIEVQAVEVAPVPPPPPAVNSVPIPHWDSRADQAAVVEAQSLPLVLARATRHPPSVADLPWIKSAQRRRNKMRLSDVVSWLVTIAIMGGMIGVAATYLTGPRPNSEPVAQR
jgi:hypothetical protein